MGQLCSNSPFLSLWFHGLYLYHDWGGLKFSHKAGVERDSGIAVFWNNNSKEGSKFSLPLSNSRTSFSYQFFQWGLFCFVLFISLCDFIKINLCINSELPVTRCPGQPKSIHVATAWMRLCRHDQHNEGKAAHTLERNWNTAVRITTHSCFIKSNASYFWSKLSTAFIEEADLCMQQRNHFQRNQGNEVGWQAGFVASLGFKTQIFHAQFLQFLIWK